MGNDRSASPIAAYAQSTGLSRLVRRTATVPIMLLNFAPAQQAIWVSSASR